MARKLKNKTDKNKKSTIDNLYNFYLNSLEETNRRKLDKNMLKKIYKDIEYYNLKKFRYLAFDSLFMSIAIIDEYLKEDVAFHTNIGFGKYLDLSQTLLENLTIDFQPKPLDKDILETMSSNFFKYAVQNNLEINSITTDLTINFPYKIKSSQNFIKEIITKNQIDPVYKEHMVLITLEHTENNLLKYLELRKIDFNFLKNIMKILKIMNLVLKTEEVTKFVFDYSECVYSLQRIIDYIYFKEILSISFDSIPDYILKHLKTQNVA